MASINIRSISVGDVTIQSGNGTPDHIAVKGSIYIDMSTAIEYINKDGIATWAEFLDSTNTSIGFSGGTVSGATFFSGGLSATTFSATTYLGLPLDIHTTGFTFNPATYDITIKGNDGINYSQNLGILASDMTITGGTYNINTGVVTFTNNTGGTFSVTGFTSGMTDSYTTSANLSGETIQFNNNLQGPNFYNVSLTPLLSDKFNISGGTVSGATKFTNGLTANTFSATTYLGLPTDIFTTGGTYSAGTAIFTNTTGGTFNVTGFSTSNGTTFTGGTVSGATNFISGLTANTFSIIDPSTTFNIVGNSFGQTSLISPTGAIVLTPGIYGVQVNGAFPDLTVNGTITSGGLGGIGTRMVTASSTGLLGTQDIPNGFTGGTVSGATNFTNGLTANTFSATSINMVDYIVFNTGTTSTATVAGTVYFDNTEHALSYNTSINQGVTVNMGQQNYIRVFNNTGVDIQKGKALEILSAYSGLPSVTLALNKHEGFNIVGVSAELIPNNTEGIAITNGIISDIQLTGITVGSLVYASDTVPGKLDDATKYFSFPLTARTNSVGYVIQTGNTTGKLFVNIQNENSVLSLTDLQRNVLEGNAISTGVFAFSGITLGVGNTFNIGNTQGWVVDNTTDFLNPNVVYINYSGQTGLTTPYLTAYTETYILLTTAATITLLHDYPSPQQRRQNIYLGKLGHGNKTSIINAFNEPDLDISPLSQMRDMFAPIKLINGGVVASVNGANLTFNSSAGTLYGMGINFTSNPLNPSSLYIPGNSPVTFQYRTQTGGTATNRTTIDPGFYDNGGVITAIGAPAKQATNQRIYLLQNGQFRMQYGQTVYADLTTAVAAAQVETFNTFANFRDNAILVGILSTRSDTTILTDPLYAQFLFVSKFGELGGGTGGLSTTTLQQAYNNSSHPEILTNVINGGFAVQNGTGNADNVSNLYQGDNASNVLTSFIRADGLFSGTSLATPSFSANSNGMSASTILGTTVSATTYQNLPTSYAGLTAGTISATTYQNLPTSYGPITATTISATTISATTLYSPTLDDYLYDKYMTNQYSYFLPSDASTAYSGHRTNGGTILSTGTVAPLTENPMGIQFTTSIAVGSVAAQYGTVMGGSLLGVNFQFETIRKFRINTNNGNQRFFAGISSLYSSTAPTNVDPLTLINSIGVAKLQSGGTLNFVWNDATGTASYLDLGVNFLGTATTVTYKLKISKLFGVAAINLELTKIDNSTGAVLVTGTTIDSDYNTGVNYYPVAWMGNNTGVSGAVSFKDYGCQMFKRNAIAS